MRQDAKPNMGWRRRRFLFARAWQPVPPETRDGPPDGNQQGLGPDAPARKPQADHVRQPAAGFRSLAPRFRGGENFSRRRNALPVPAPDFRVFDGADLTGLRAVRRAASAARGRIYPAAAA